MARPALPRLLIALLIVSLGAFLTALLLPQVWQLPRAALLHLVFAIGIMPLIFATMSWFTPVLTRSGQVEQRMLAPPLLALLGGLMLLLSLLFAYRFYVAAAVLALLAAAMLSYWMRGRARQALGPAHPGLLWYQLALALLMLGLLAIIVGIFWPQQWLALRRLHLHLNLLGFVALTALGTLRVLLPTVAGFTDPHASRWLQQSWRWLLTGTLLIAFAAAWWPPLSIVGGLLWLLPLTRLLVEPVYRQRRLLLQLHGAAPTLLCAITGLWLLLASGFAHAVGLLPANTTLDAYVPLFLLPLVTGAASHLLPLWLFPAQPQLQQSARSRLARYGGIRGLLFLLAGITALTGMPFAWLPALFGLGHFIFSTAMLVTLRRVV